MANYGDLQKKYPNLEVWGHPSEYRDLYDLTVSGYKTATSSWYASYLNENEELDYPGSLSIMVDNPENPKYEVLLETQKVVIEKFEDISVETAYCNGEGDRSVSDWKRIFGDFWEKQLPKEGLTFDKEGLVVTEFFHVKEI